MRCKNLVSYLFLAWVAFTSVCWSPVFAQENNILDQNLTNVKVDELSAGQIMQIKSQLNSAGISDDQIDDQLLSRGMAGDEVNKFMARLNDIKEAKGSLDVDNNGTQVSTVNGQQANNFEATTPTDSLESKIYGMSLFTMANSPINPNLNIAPTENYIIGPGDQLLIDITGRQLVNWSVTVNPENFISIPQGIGKVYVGGKTLEEAKELITAKLIANNYQIGRGTDVSITITNIRTVNVTILGEVRRPGNYTLSSLQTVFNALYLSGGPTKIGSFRDISVIRGGQKVASIDIYDFLQHGEMSGNVNLQDNDIIRVPTYDTRVEIAGEVKRPGIYEVLPGETLKNIILYAGGVTDQAYTARIKVVQMNDKEKRVADISYKDFDNYVPLRGDQIVVDAILDRYENRVTLNGAVFRPGEYELTPGMSLKQLIERSEGLKEDAFMERGYITRLNPDNTTEVIPFNVSDVVTDRRNITLQREDVVEIRSIFDLRDAQFVSISGGVRNPGKFPYSKGMTVNDVILQSGGFTDYANLQKVEVARRVRDSDKSKSDAKVATIFQINIDKDLKDAGFKLEPFDIISVFALPGYEPQQTVVIEGEVMTPGRFVVVNKNERISDLVSRAGGFTAYAYLEGASLKRSGKPDTRGEAGLQKVKEKQFDKVQEEAVETGNVNVNLNDQTLRNNFVGIDLAYIMKHPHSDQDLILEEGDLLTVPKLLQTVKISGQVLYPTTVLYEPGKSLKEYIVSSGGYSEEALKRKTYVFGANGKAANTRPFLFFKRYPKIKPGSEIFVPQRKPRSESMTVQAWIGLGTSMASLAALVFAVVNTASK